MRNKILDIRELRSKKGYTLEYISKKIGLSVPYLSQLERNERNFSFNDYVKILDLLGYEFIIQEKGTTEELNMCKEETKTNTILKDEDLQELIKRKPLDSSSELKIASEKIINTLKEMNPDNDILIKILKYTVKYNTREAKSLINFLPVLFEHDKKLLEVFKDKLQKVITLGNKNPETWSKNEKDWYAAWGEFDCELFAIGYNKRTQKFKITAEENKCIYPMTSREYTLKNGTPITVIYWLNSKNAEYSYELRTEEKGISTFEAKERLLSISDDMEFTIANEDIIKELSGEDKQEIFKIMKEAYIFEKHFTAQLLVAFRLIQITDTIVTELYKTKVHPDRYTDEYLKDIKQFYM